MVGGGSVSDDMGGVSTGDEVMLTSPAGSWFSVEKSDNGLLSLGGLEIGERRGNRCRHHYGRYRILHILLEKKKHA